MECDHDSRLRSFGGGKLFYLIDNRLIFGAVAGVFADVHVAYAPFFIYDEDRRVSNAVMLFRVQDAVRLYDFSVAVGKYLVFRSSSQRHRPGKVFIVTADGY